MAVTKLNDLVTVLQIAVAPVILISGVGLVLLSLTNRFARAVDRSRQLAHEMRQASEADRPRLNAQLANLFKRAKLIQTSIVLAVMSVLFASVLIMVLFLAALLQWEMAVFIILLFSCCLLALFFSMIVFILEIRLSLKALRVELGEEVARFR